VRDHLRAGSAEDQPPTAEELCRLTAILCQRLQVWYDRWTHDGFGPIRQALRPWMGLIGQPARITAGPQDIEGTVQDLDEAGRLLVRLDSGIVRAFEMGEVTLLR
jgi:biotin-(acetyl-CoA carboxylase) ligase